MNAERRHSLQQSLRRLAASYADTLRVLERTYALLSDELALEPTEYCSRLTPDSGSATVAGLVIDPARLTVTFRGRTCFLGLTLPFRLLSRLARSVDCYVTHSDLIDEVWGGAHRCDSVIKNVVKVLRQKLRFAGLNDLADSIDGSAPGRYALKLPR